MANIHEIDKKIFQPILKTYLGEGWGSSEAIDHYYIDFRKAGIQ
jgi:hypothetical protein